METQLELVKIELPLLRFVTLAKGREVFEKNKLEHQTFENGMENMIPILIKAYGPTYAHFDRREKDVTKNIFSAFIKGTSQIFSILAGDIDKTSSIPLAKFTIISICFRIDKAIFAYKDLDLMWEELEYEREDLHFLQKPNFRVSLPHLSEIREMFDHFFRDNRYDSFFYQEEVVDPPQMETQEEKFLFPKPFSTRANRGYLAPPEVNTFSPSLSNPSRSEKEKNFHPVSQRK
jgi:hypothetical protein